MVLVGAPVLLETESGHTDKRCDKKCVWTEFVSEISRSELGRCHDKSFPTCYACPEASGTRFNRSWSVFKVNPFLSSV